MFGWLVARGSTLVAARGASCAMAKRVALEPAISMD